MIDYFILCIYQFLIHWTGVYQAEKFSWVISTAIALDVKNYVLSMALSAKTSSTKLMISLQSISTLGYWLESIYSITACQRKFTAIRS